MRSSCRTGGDCQKQRARSLSAVRQEESKGSSGTSTRTRGPCALSGVVEEWERRAGGRSSAKRRGTGMSVERDSAREISGEIQESERGIKEGEAGGRDRCGAGRANSAKREEKRVAERERGEGKRAGPKQRDPSAREESGVTHARACSCVLTSADWAQRWSRACPNASTSSISWAGRAGRARPGHSSRRFRFLFSTACAAAASGVRAAAESPEADRWRPSGPHTRILPPRRIHPAP